MELLIGLVINGILMGGVYSLIALGITVIFKSSKILHFCQGTFVLSGGILGWVLVGVLGLPAWLGLPLTLVGCGLIGMLIERIALRPIIGQPIIASIMVTVAVAWLFESMSLLVTNAQKAFPVQLASGNMHWGPILINKTYLLCFSIAIALSIVFVLFYQYHMVGLAMRGTSEDHEVIQSMGIKVTNMRSYSWLIAGITGGMGGILLASMTSVSLSLAAMGTLALVLVLVGGMESISGVLLMGPVIGILENLSIYLDFYVGGGAREVVPYVILVVVLLIKPYGLFGLERIERI